MWGSSPARNITPLVLWWLTSTIGLVIFHITNINRNITPLVLSTWKLVLTSTIGHWLGDISYHQFSPQKDQLYTPEISAPKVSNWLQRYMCYKQELTTELVNHHIYQPCIQNVEQHQDQKFCWLTRWLQLMTMLVIEENDVGSDYNRW